MKSVGCYLAHHRVHILHAGHFRWHHRVQGMLSFTSRCIYFIPAILALGSCSFSAYVFGRNRRPSRNKTRSTFCPCPGQTARLRYRYRHRLRYYSAPYRLHCSLCYVSIARSQMGVPCAHAACVRGTVWRLELTYESCHFFCIVLSLIVVIHGHFQHCACDAPILQ